jgi:hypothetical protein
MQVKTIDEVISALEVIIQQTLKDENPMGYFAVLYHRVTVTVKQGIATSYYSDCARMEKLDVLFANRYLEAYAQFQQGQPCTQSWQYAFDTSKKFWPTVMQNLLLGINAHINLDLGIAAVQTCPGEGIHALKDDFDKINMVLASMVADVEKSMVAIWPTLKVLLEKIGKVDSFLVNFSLEQARNGAWKFATELATMSPAGQQDAIVKRDKKIAEIALLVSKPGFFISSLFMFVRLGEIGSVAKKMAALQESKLKE